MVAQSYYICSGYCPCQLRIRDGRLMTLVFFNGGPASLHRDKGGFGTLSIQIQSILKRGGLNLECKKTALCEGLAVTSLWLQKCIDKQLYTDL